MTTSLTKEEIMERFQQRVNQFSDEVGKRTKPQLPLTIDSYDELAVHCGTVIAAFLEVVFTEDK
ncbi:hypothetical protein ACFLWO_00040 [Chloroflexota bacterium]